MTFTDNSIKEALNKLIPFMVRQAHHERNQTLAVRPELVEGLVQRFLKVNGTAVRMPRFSETIHYNLHKEFSDEVS
jgi:hypothetical protein